MKRKPIPWMIVDYIQYAVDCTNVPSKIIPWMIITVLSRLMTAPFLLAMAGPLLLNQA